ncbi:hypothetical protein SRABI70_04820 [Pseudomonas sp. Bi70]|nr:hypothetical protein SRABI70_04820 [Pseudomonas sp. Bi70]
MATAMDLRLDQPTRPFTHVERADAFGAIALVRRERHQVHRQAGQVDHHLAGGLGSVDMKQRAALTHPFANRGDIGEGAQLVVDAHQRHQQGIVTQRRRHGLGLDQALAVRLQPGDLEAVELQLPGGIQHGLVFQAAGHDMPAPLRRGCHALERQVVGFGGTGCPHQVVGAGTDQFGDLPARLFHGTACALAERMRGRRRIAEGTIAAHMGQHVADYLIVDGRGGGVVEVALSHGIKAVWINRGAAWSSGSEGIC